MTFFWVNLGSPAGRRPVCVLTRDAALQVLSAVTRAPITRTIREIRSEVEVGPEEGLPSIGVITCDSIVTLPIGLLASNRIGHLNLGKRAELDLALRYALDIQY